MEIFEYGNSSESIDLSVIVPAYNVEDYLRDCLASLLPQGGLTIQLVIINDGSTDGTLRKAKDFFSLNKELISGVIVDQKNHGLSYARNVGAKLARGTFLTFLDSDDIVLPKAYERAVSLGKKDKCDLVISKGLSFDNLNMTFRPFNDFQIWGRIFSNNVKKTTTTSSFESPEVYGLEPNTSIRIFDSRFFQSQEFEYPNGLYYEDIFLHFDMCNKASSIGLINETLLLYRMNRPGKITEDNSKKRFDVLQAVTQLRSSQLVTLPSATGKYILDQITRLVFWCGRNTHPDDTEAFYSKMAENFSLLPSSWFDEYCSDGSFELKGRYIAHKAHYGHGITLANLALEKVNKPDVAYFVYKYNGSMAVLKEILKFVGRGK